MPEDRDAPGSGLLRLFRAAPFRLTLLSLALFAFAGAAFLAYVYVAATGEARRRTDAEILREAASLVEVSDRAGAQVDALDPPGIDPDLPPWHRSRQAGNLRAVDLEGESFVRCRGEGIGP